MIERVEALLDQVEGFPEPQREITTELVAALLDMYGEGLSRIVSACEVPVEDEVVAHLLFLHGLHPVPVEQRVLGALDGVMADAVALGVAPDGLAEGGVRLG